jgi:heme A synthase
MEFFALAHSLSQVMSAVSLDESSMSVLVMLAGIIGGWTVTGLLQPKPKKVKVDRKDDTRLK